MVVGTVAVDSVETPFGKKDAVFGGSASYFSYAASFFSPVNLVAVVGSDFPEEYRNVLKERPIGLEHLQTANGKTFHWKGKYEADMNAALTLETHLNVLLDFKPRLKAGHEPETLFLANIDPDLQMTVLDQVQRPKCRFIACDTMNYWIEQKRSALKKVLARVDMVVVNDGEARLLSEELNLIKAGRAIQALGPGIVIVKKGEHGALLFHGEKFFTLPAYPLEEVFDPTGAGDSFAGGVMGYLTKTADTGFENVKKAVVHGAVIASFTVEHFGLERLRNLREGEIEERLGQFQRICMF
ncbi:MAG: sugar kinase [Omnitrophica bacterium RIFCSPLOWO2_01_FULL_50_24]|nr:MAG: sugar kinase [Omnitrophica bacterium RIFCSPLOWO2_01_FULL_50_24]